jgi:hypothetical protein
MTLVLITEAENYFDRPMEVIVEQTKLDDGRTSRQYFMEGPFIQTEIKNRNGRNYGLDLMTRCVDKYKRERMDPNFGLRSFGELGHPEGVEINLDKVCMYTTSLDWQGKDCIGKAKVLTNHPCGRILQTFLEDKLRIGVSTRGLGALSEDENPDGSKDVDAYEMIAIDAVADPSAPKGFVDGILENKQYIVKDDGVILECYEGLQQKVSVLPRKLEERAQHFANALTEFLDGIKKS